MRRTRWRFVLAGSMAFAAVLPAACSDDDEAASGTTTSTTTAGTTSAGAASPSPEVDQSTAPVQNDAARCRIDTRTLRTAQEAYIASTGRYAASTAELVTAGMLAEESPLHSIVIPEAVPGPDGVPAPAFEVVVVDPVCGTPGHRVNQTPADS